METNQSLLHNKPGNGLINNLKASKNTITDLNLVQDGEFYPSSRTTHSSSSSHCQQSSDWKTNRSWDSWRTSSWTEQSFFFSVIVQRCHFASQKFNLLAVDRRSRQTHVLRTTSSHAQLLHIRLFLLVVIEYSHTLTSMHLPGSSHEAQCLRFAQKHSHLILVAQLSCTLQKPDTTHGHSFLAFS